MVNLLWLTIKVAQHGMKKEEKTNHARDGAHIYTYRDLNLFFFYFEKVCSCVFS